MELWICKIKRVNDDGKVITNESEHVNEDAACHRAMEFITRILPRSGNYLAAEMRVDSEVVSVEVLMRTITDSPSAILWSGEKG